MSERKVFRYPLNYMHTADVDMHEGAEILCVKRQPARDFPSLWALVNPDAPIEVRRFVVRATGVYVAPDGEIVNYIGSYIEDDGFHIYHVFELLKEKK